MSELQDALDLYDDPQFNVIQSASPELRTIIAAARKVAELDYLRAAIGYGIDLQEAIDIVDLALGGGMMTPTLQRIYDRTRRPPHCKEHIE